MFYLVIEAPSPPEATFDMEEAGVSSGGAMPLCLTFVFSLNLDFGT